MLIDRAFEGFFIFFLFISIFYFIRYLWIDFKFIIYYMSYYMSYFIYFIRNKPDFLVIGSSFIVFIELIIYWIYFILFVQHFIYLSDNLFDGYIFSCHIFDSFIDSSCLIFYNRYIMYRVLFISSPHNYFIYCIVMFTKHLLSVVYHILNIKIYKYKLYRAQLFYYYYISSIV
jgi:hypothetical protein